MKKRVFSMALAVVLCLGLVPSALAYTTPDFSDLPADNWAYGPVMRMADQGIIQGTGGGMFSPTMKVSAAQFLTLVGRIVFPETTVGPNDTWYGPHMAACQNAGFLAGTQVNTSTPEAEISRYDMAVVLRAAAKKLGKAETLAQQSQVTDYGMVPTMYADAVLAVYGMGLITGDQNGNFNGSNTMMRNELATVIDRLVALKAPSGSTTDPGTTTEPEPSTEAAYTLDVQTNAEIGDIVVPGDKIGVSCRVLPSYEAAPYAHYDRTGFTCVSSDPTVAEITETTDWLWYVTAHREGTATITVTDPYGVTGSKTLTVVSARENLGTETHTLSIRTAERETHTLRGAAYTETDFIYSIPYKVYYTRDGGKTSQLVYEGISPSKEGKYADTVTVDLPEDAFYSQDAGFYISAETVMDGQRLVTSDLRTDGRAYVSLVKSRGAEHINDMYIQLTPPTGEKAKFTINGAVAYRPSGANTDLCVGAGFTVQLHLKDGRVLAETTTDATGSYSLDCEVDAIDNGFDPRVEQYYVTASGVHDGVSMETWIPAGKTQQIRSLNTLGANPYNKTNVGNAWPILVAPK